MIVVTGARGFLGGYLVGELLSQGKDLWLATSDRAAVGNRDALSYHYLDLGDPDFYRQLPESIEAVVHLAALIPRKGVDIPFHRFMEVNAQGTQSMLAAAAERGCGRFIYASTQAVIGRTFYLPVDERHPVVPTTDYGLSKAVGERYCLSYAESSRMQVVSLRFAQVYGAGGSQGFVLEHFIDRARRGLPLVVHGTGRVARDLAYVKDAVQAITAALSAEVAASGVLNIGGGRGVSIKELAETIKSVFADSSSPVELEPSKEEQGTDFYMDISRAHAVLGYSPRYSLRDGMRDYQTELLKGRGASPA